MKAVILAGGIGKRLKPITEKIPKPLIQISGKPFLYYLLTNIQHSGIKKIILIVNYKIQMIKKFVQEFGFDVEIIDQGQPLGTAHAISKAKEVVDDSFLVVMGDNLYSSRDIKRIAFPDNFCYVGAIMHKHPELYGNLVLEGDFLSSIVEKPREKVSDLINTGLYKFTPKIFDAISKINKSQRGEFEITDAINLLCKEKIVKVYKLRDYWKDMGKLEDIPILEKFVKKRFV